MELYRRVPPPPDSIPINTSPLAIDESISSMENIEWAVHRLWHHRLGGRGALRMQKKHLQSWLEAVTSKERPDTSNWDWAVEILQTKFRDVRLPTEFTWKTMVLIPKGNGEFWGIGIVEVLCKELSVVINKRIGEALHFHDFLHCLRAGKRMENTSLKVKLIQMLTETRE